ncbi:MAG: TIGR00375 family protein [Candidatus Altiarchaeales archaeon]|nr:TIGR00375 family protein [Candidatus Altiarchaeales archaeon]MBD3417059.1 TIGR00375 family protein [Candidatus Altiarchaeales archaeon]
MLEANVDFHIHGKYSGGTSKDMTVPLIAEQAPLKGLDVVATSDALHPMWRKHLREHLIDEEGLYTTRHSKTRFIVQAEVEDVKRVHHVILLPSLSAADSLAEALKPHSPNLRSDGRPNVRLNGEELADHVEDVNGLIGPSHAFTPWTAVYKEYDSLKECYGDNLKRVRFLELGLSADTYAADRIEELQDLTYMTNSDCHSPWPHRLGREFNRVEVKELTFEEMRKAISRDHGRKFTLNVGLKPLEGKYHVTACSRCYLKFKWEEAMKLKRRCPECRGIIKKGVAERIDELATWEEPRHPTHRPHYIHILPLAEVIALATRTRTITSKKVKERWDALVGKFKTEINVLVDEDIEEIIREDREVGAIIKMFREGRMKYVAGGGGMYGHPTLDGERDRYYKGGQKTLSDY